MRALIEAARAKPVAPKWNGGHARAASLSPERRSEIAAMGARAREAGKLQAAVVQAHAETLDGPCDPSPLPELGPLYDAMLETSADLGSFGLPAAKGEVGRRGVPSVQPGELGGEGQASVRGGVDGQRGGPAHAWKPVGRHAPSIRKARAEQPVATLPVPVWRRVEFTEEGTLRECATGLKERGIRVKIRGLVMLWEDRD